MWGVLGYLVGVCRPALGVRKAKRDYVLREPVALYDPGTIGSNTEVYNDVQDGIIKRFDEANTGGMRNGFDSQSQLPETS